MTPLAYFLAGCCFGALFGINVFATLVDAWAKLAVAIENRLLRETPAWWAPIAAVLIIGGLLAAALFGAVLYSQAG
jgi:hypothetical protein